MEQIRDANNSKQYNSKKTGKTRAEVTKTEMFIAPGFRKELISHCMTIFLF